MKTKLFCVIIAIILSFLANNIYSNTTDIDGLNNNSIKNDQYKINVTVTNNKSEDISVKYKKVRATFSQIDIEPSGDYYNRYNSNSRFNVDLKEGVFETYYEFPTVKCYIINNTKSYLNISSLDVDVEYSKIDKTPYIYIISTLHDTHCMSFYNFSCYNWGNMTFEYTIFRKGEQFNNKYKSKRIIPYFDYGYKINFLSELKSLGYNVDKVAELYEKDKDFRNNYYGVFTKAEINRYKYLFYPFDFFSSSLIMSKYVDDNYYYPFAPIYGRLTFSNSNKIVEFKGYICLTSVDGLGGITFIDDSFTIKLKTSTSNYVLHYPYKTVIPPGGSECIKLTIACDKSSNHRFRLKAINHEGRNIISKYINLHMLNHKGIHIVTDKGMN